MKQFPQLRWFWKLDARTRLLLAIGVAIFVSEVLPASQQLPTRVLLVWDAGMICFLGLSWFVMLKATPQTMRRRAQRQDEGRLAILILLIAAACSSLLAIGFMLKDNQNASAGLVVFHVTLAAITIFGSWLLVHTLFAFHYAHNYYQDDAKAPSRRKTGGLEFPDDTEPDYWDFLYFSFVIGMTSQVSDVEVSSRSLRRLALMHGVLSFFFNTAIVAMSINMIAGLI